MIEKIFELLQDHKNVVVPFPNFNQYSKFLEELEKTTDIRWGGRSQKPTYGIGFWSNYTNNFCLHFQKIQQSIGLFYGRRSYFLSRNGFYMYYPEHPKTLKRIENV